MKSLVEHLNEGLLVEAELNMKPKNKKELKTLVDRLIKERGNNADLNDIDTSLITDMSELFYRSKFNGDISKWDISSVTDMSKMFMYSNFNRDLSNWDVSKVKKMNYIFKGTPLEYTGPSWYKMGALTGRPNNWNKWNTNPMTAEEKEKLINGDFR